MNLRIDELRNAYVGWIKRYDHIYHLTLNCSANTKQTIARSQLNTAIADLNKQIFKGRYYRQVNYLTGFVAEEETPQKNSYHYHVILIDHARSPKAYLPNHVDLDNKVSKIRKTLCYRQPKLRTKYFFDDHLLQECDIAAPAALAAYITKDMEKGYKDGIGVLGPDGVSFGDIAQHKQMWQLQPIRSAVSIPRN